MSWSLCGWEPEDPELVDAALLSAGKALYLCNAFESKCHFVLQFLRLVDHFENDPAASYADAVARVAQKKKMLGGTLSEMKGFPPLTDEHVAVLDKSRNARNNIAHEGAFPGYVWNAEPAHIYEHVHKLRGLVRDLAAGDHLVSGWSHIIQEKDPCGNVMPDYPDMIDSWVFGWLDEPEHQPPYSSSRRLRGTAGLRIALGIDPLPGNQQ